MSPDLARSLAASWVGVKPDDLHLLGQGSFGTAWRAPWGSVIKITQDPSELRLVELGKSHACEGLPKIQRGPIPLGSGVYAYEREDLQNLPERLGSLSELTVVAKPLTPMSREERLRRYEAIIYDDRTFVQFPEIVNALRRFRRHGIVVWDLKRSNLGLRAERPVIRDGRCIVLSSWGK